MPRRKKVELTLEEKNQCFDDAVAYLEGTQQDVDDAFKHLEGARPKDPRWQSWLSKREWYESVCKLARHTEVLSLIRKETELNTDTK